MSVIFSPQRQTNRKDIIQSAKPPLSKRNVVIQKNCDDNFFIKDRFNMKLLLKVKDTSSIASTSAGISLLSQASSDTQNNEITCQKSIFSSIKHLDQDNKQKRIEFISQENVRQSSNKILGSNQDIFSLNSFDSYFSPEKINQIPSSNKVNISSSSSQSSFRSEKQSSQFRLRIIKKNNISQTYTQEDQQPLIDDSKCLQVQLKQLQISNVKQSNQRIKRQVSSQSSLQSINQNLTERLCNLKRQQSNILFLSNSSSDNQKELQLQQQNENRQSNHFDNFIVLQKLKEESEVETFKVIDRNTLKLSILKRINPNKYQFQNLKTSLENNKYPFGLQESQHYLNYEEIQPNQKLNYQQVNREEQYPENSIIVKCEYVQNESLSNLLKYSKILNETCIKNIFGQVVNSILQIHKKQQSSLKQGLSFDNILFDSNFNIKLGYKFTSDTIDDDFKRIKQLSLFQSIKTPNIKTNNNQYSQEESDIVLNIGYLILKSIISPTNSLFQSQFLSKITNSKSKLQNSSCCIYHDIQFIVKNKIQDSFIDQSKALEMYKFIQTNFSQNMESILCGSLRYNSRQRFTLDQLQEHFQFNEQLDQNSHEKLVKLFTAVKIKRILSQKSLLINQAQKEIQEVKEKIVKNIPNKVEVAKKLVDIIVYEGIFTKNQVFQLLLSKN